MRRYKRLGKKDIFDALNKLRDAFLAAKNGNEVDEIMSWLLTQEEKIKLGRRILIAELLNDEVRFLEICSELKVGNATVSFVAKQLEEHFSGFELINSRSKKLEEKYTAQKYRKATGSKLVFKKKEYTGIKKSDIERG